MPTESVRYMTIPEAAVRWKTEPHVLRGWCEKQRIQGARRVSGIWLVPATLDRDHARDRNSVSESRPAGTILRRFV